MLGYNKKHNIPQIEMWIVKLNAKLIKLINNKNFVLHHSDIYIIEYIIQKYCLTNK